MTLRPHLMAITLLMVVGLVVPGRAQQPTRDVAGSGLTRDSLYAPASPASTPAPVAASAHARLDKTAHHPRYTVEVYQPSRHPVAPRHPAAARTAAHTRPRRNVAVRFVYWWNGWVIRKFHTKFGTVLLGTIGAQS